MLVLTRPGVTYTTVAVSRAVAAALPDARIVELGGEK